MLNKYHTFEIQLSFLVQGLDSVRDDDEAGTDGDDEAEIVDGKTHDSWVEVKSKKQDRKSLPKELNAIDQEQDTKNDGREELEFQFDEDLDMPVPGRQNKFSAMYVNSRPFLHLEAST